MRVATASLIPTTAARPISQRSVAFVSSWIGPLPSLLLMPPRADRGPSLLARRPAGRRGPPRRWARNRALCPLPGRPAATPARADNGGTASRATCVGLPGPSKPGTGAAGLPSNKVTGGGLASRPGLARRSPRTGIATTSSSGLNCRVEVLELDPGILGREAPVDATTGSVACRLPGHDLPLQRQPISHPPIQALLRQHAQLDLGHVQPAAMLGCVVDLEPVGGAAWPQPARTPRTATQGCGC